jgi:HAE1 family hydrophobic/amphiphilic exporter-1
MGDKEVEMQAGFRLEDRQDLTRLLDFPMYSATTGGSVPLRSLVEAEVGRGVGTIRREDRITAWPLTVDFAPDLSEGAGRAAVLAALDSVDFPRGYGHDFGRWEMDQASEDQALLQALVLSLVFVFVIMGVLFESVLLPLAVLTSIPMALIGVYWALFLTGSPLDAMGGVGLIILMGVVVNNGIVLIELVTRLRHEGYSREAALVEAGRRRLRPILMTALTTIVGLIPMATGSATFVGIPYAPLGRVLGGGMITGTVLTLLFVPFMYTVLDDMRGTAARWLAWWVVRRAEDRPSAVEPQ